MIDAWLDGDAAHKAEDLKAALLAASSAGKLAPAIEALGEVKLKRAQIKSLQEFRDLYVCVRSEAARYGTDRCVALLHLHTQPPSLSL